MFIAKNTSKGRIHPHKDWTIMVSITLGVILAIIIFSLYLFGQINQEAIFQVSYDSNIQADTINEAKLKEVVNNFNEKEAFSKNIIEQGFETTDPSI